VVIDGAALADPARLRPTDVRLTVVGGTTVFERAA
jgi:predicted amidohydrolase YtcJ